LSGTSSEAETAYPSGALKFSGARVPQFLVICVAFCRSFFVLLAIVFYFLLRLTDFGIFKLFISFKLTSDFTGTPVSHIFDSLNRNEDSIQYWKGVGTVLRLSHLCLKNDSICAPLGNTCCFFFGLLITVKFSCVICDFIVCWIPSNSHLTYHTCFHCLLITVKFTGDLSYMLSLSSDYIQIHRWSVILISLSSDYRQIHMWPIILISLSSVYRQIHRWPVMHAFIVFWLPSNSQVTCHTDFIVFWLTLNSHVTCHTWFHCLLITVEFAGDLSYVLSLSSAYLQIHRSPVIHAFIVFWLPSNSQVTCHTDFIVFWLPSNSQVTCNACFHCLLITSNSQVTCHTCFQCLLITVKFTGNKSYVLSLSFDYRQVTCHTKRCVYTMQLSSKYALQLNFPYIEY